MVIDLANARTQRAAAAASAAASAAAAAQKRDPWSSPRVVLIVQLLLEMLILDRAMRESTLHRSDPK